MLIVSRDEIYLNAILTGDTSNLPTPISRVDEYLYQIALNGVTSTSLDSTLKSGAKYQLGILTEDIILTLPETATSDIEVDFAIADTVHNINCDYLSLDVVANAYYQVLFCYDKALKTWFSSVVSNDYNPVSTTAEVENNETP